MAELRNNLFVVCGRDDPIKDMNEISEIIINASYRDFFIEGVSFHKEQYSTSSFAELDALDNNALTGVLALLFQNYDTDRHALYGIEVKSNGSSRSGRIPLVRVSKNNPSIWKISARVEDLQKTITAMDNLVYFLKQHNSSPNYPIPLKVIVLRDDENRYAAQKSPHYKFVHDLVEKSGIVLFSLQFIRNLLTDNNPVDLDSYLKKPRRVFTATQNS